MAFNRDTVHTQSHLHGSRKIDRTSIIDQQQHLLAYHIQYPTSYVEARPLPRGQFNGNTIMLVVYSITCTFKEVDIAFTALNPLRRLPSYMRVTHTSCAPQLDQV
jgi:hypothetical protein